MPSELDAPKEVQQWFSEARLSLSNKIKAEILLPSKEEPYLNKAAIWLFAGDGNLQDLRGSITVFGGGYINISEPVYGNFEYIVHEMQNNKSFRCNDKIINDRNDLRSELNKSLSDFIAIAAELP